MKRKLFYLLGILLLLTVTNCSNTDRKKEKEVNIHGTAIVLTNNCIQSDEYAEKTYKLVYYGYIKDTVETMSSKNRKALVSMIGTETCITFYDTIIVR